MFGGVLLLPTSFLLFLFFHKVKECEGTPNRFFFSFFQFSDMENLENFSKNLAKFPHYYFVE